MIDATCALVDFHYPTDLSLLNVFEVFSEGVAREVTEILIDAMHPKGRESFGHKSRAHRKQARQQFLAVAMKKRPRINKIRKAIKQQLGHLKRNLASIDGLIARGGCLLAAGRHIYQKLMVMNLEKLLDLLFILFTALLRLFLVNEGGSSICTVPLKHQIAAAC